MPTEKFGIVYYTTQEAAEEIGRSKSTLLRTIREKKINDVTRNHLGYREWLLVDIERFRKYYRGLNSQRVSRPDAKGRRSA